MYAGKLSCRLRADADDFRMRIGAAHESRMKCSRQAQIVDEAALAGEQRRILLALDRGPEPLCSHGIFHLLRAPPVVAIPVPSYPSFWHVRSIHWRAWGRDERLPLLS